MRASLNPAGVSFVQSVAQSGARILDKHSSKDSFQFIMPNDSKMPISDRFRGFLPVVVDVETGGFNAQTDALLEIAATVIEMGEGGHAMKGDTVHCHVNPFEGANIEQASLDITGIKIDHPFRFAIDEKEALTKVFQMVRSEMKRTGCKRAILVGHNAWFDLSFLNAAVERTKIKRNPFHPFSSFDTATLAGMFYGQTVLARAMQVADIEWDTNQAHGALYDTEKTAELFCKIINQSHDLYTHNIAGGNWQHENAADDNQD